MLLTLLCVGRLGASPEGALARDYAASATALARSLGLGPVEIVEIVGRKRGKLAESEAILVRSGDAPLIALDERGDALTSRAFATWLGAQRREGSRHLVFVVGGADGLDPAVLKAARRTLSLGPATWPHALARVMLAEQIYRAVTILSGGPYHRD